MSDLILPSARMTWIDKIRIRNMDVRAVARSGLSGSERVQRAFDRQQYMDRSPRHPHSSAKGQFSRNSSVRIMDKNGVSLRGSMFPPVRSVGIKTTFDDKPFDNISGVA